MGVAELELAAELDDSLFDEMTDEDVGLELLEDCFALLDEDFILIEDELLTWTWLEKKMGTFVARENALIGISLEEDTSITEMESDEFGSSCAWATSSLQATATMHKKAANM